MSGESLPRAADLVIPGVGGSVGSSVDHSLHFEVELLSIL